MKKTLLFIILLFFSFSLVLAQKKAKRTPEQKADKLTEEMTTVMGLDASQKTKVYQANLKQAKALAGIKAEIKRKYPDKESRKANKEAIKESYKPQKKAIKQTRKDELKASGISEEQWKKWKAHQKQKKSERKAKK